MSYYGFDYFCGANVTVQIGDYVLLEAAGLSYNLSHSKRPIYGYSSVLFDAVARGQQLIDGVLVVNYVHQDYLFRMIEMSSGVPFTTQAAAALAGTTVEQDRLLVEQSQELGLAGGGGYSEALKKRFWSPQQENHLSRPFHKSTTPSMLVGSLDIKVVFGDRNPNRPNGDTGFTLSTVHFTGESKVIRISEETIVETYPFFARDRFSLRNNVSVLEEVNDAGVVQQVVQ